MNLKEAILTAASAVQNKSTLPVLSAVAIRSKDGVMEFTGTDLEVGIRTTAEYDAPEFECCIDAKRLVSAISLMDRPVIKKTNSQIIIQQGSMRFALPFLPFDLHPGLAKHEDGGVEIDGSIVNMMADVRYAAGKNDVRHYLNGVYIVSENGKLSVIASDGYRVAVRYSDCAHDFKTIVPIKSVGQIIKYKPETIIVGRMIKCIKPGFEMICTPIDARFPSFERMIERTSENITIDKKALLVTLSAFNALRDVNPQSAVSMSWSKDELLMSSVGGDKSEVEDRLPATFTSEYSIGVNIGFLSDMVSAIDSDSITLEFSKDANKPIISWRENAMDVVMLMRV